MAKKRKSRGKLIHSYAEKLPGTVFGVFWKEFRGLVKGKSGIYVLYKHRIPYYVGQASSLPFRIKHHQNDRHENKWDAFSFYVVNRTRYLKHLESLLLRIVDPQGARQSGRFPGAHNLRKKFVASLEPFANALKDLKKS
jgi:hypothetical protein